MNLPRLALLLLLAAHGGIPDELRAAPAANPTNVIAQLSHDIERNPRRAELFLKRGELHRVLKNWDAALADFQQAAALDPNLTIVDLATAQLLLDAGWPLAGKGSAEKFLLRNPNHTDGLATLARAHFKLGQAQAAADVLGRAITVAREPGPELFIERAHAIASLGSHRLDEALRVIEDGMRRHGALVTLQLYAIDLEARAKRFDVALARLDKVTAQSARKETWLARRGEILLLAGREAEARRAFEQALAAVRALSPVTRGTPGMAELERRLSLLLEPKPVVKP
jgi:tetratricopeptide (TPR) repeat protein